MKPNLFSDISPKFKKIFFNKYAIVLIIFVVFITFFDRYNLINRWKNGREVKDLKKEIEYYQNEITTNKAKTAEIQSGDESLEKYAREQYFLKKDSEDIFIIKEESLDED